MQKSRLSTGNLTRGEKLNLGLKLTLRMHIKMLKPTALASETSLDVLTEPVEEIIYGNPSFSPFHVKCCFAARVLS